MRRPAPRASYPHQERRCDHGTWPSASGNPRTRSCVLKTTGTFEHGGYTLAYESHGDGNRVVVYMHGLLLDANLNRSIAQALAVHGNRVILLDLLGHGRSDRPTHASLHRMDTYADQVIALLDHLGVDEAVIGGVSLGANVSLSVAASYPDRVRGMLLEMPVLEWAAPAAAMVFVPLLLGVHWARPLFRRLAAFTRRAPRTGYGPIDSFINVWSSDPEQTAAVLHGLLVGPTAPTMEQRARIEAPALIIGHTLDLIHPFNDAENLSQQLPAAELVRARSMAELRVRPSRLIREMSGFLDRVWAPRPARAANG